MRSIAALGLGLGLVLLAGCSGNTTSPSGPKVDEAKSSLVRDAAPTVSDADKATFANDNQAFALSAYAALAKTDGNVFFSPYSISSALAMSYAGAKGQTATEMATALHFSLPQERLHPAFDSVDLALNHSTGFTLHVTNSMWGYTQEKFQQPFLDTIATNYGAGVYLEDFVNDPHGSEDLINQWVSDQTNGKIQKILNNSIDPDTRLVLVDAIYFDADWTTAFEKESTSPGTFNATIGAVPVQMMHSHEGQLHANAAHTDAYDAIELPYNGGAVMDIVMPTAGTMAAFESSLTPDSLSKIVGGLSNGTVDLAMPKFSYAGDAISLKPLLQGMGMNVPFGEDADFTAIATDPNEHLFIQNVLHKAYLRVDEKGTEAAAATAVVMGDAAVGFEEGLSITLDHPFFFTIRDTATNTILFAGRITNPS